MSNKHFDIEDDEIRIISPKGKSRRKRVSKKTRRIIACFLVPVIIILLIMTIWLIARSGTDSKPVSPVGNNTENQASAIPPQSAIPIKKGDAFCIVKDTIVNDTPLHIITPRNAIPTLEVGYQPSADSTAVLAALAADVRGDNGMIAGAFVLKGNLLSKGKAKAGFCSIINNEVTIGVADASPMLEQALESEGYFFRQYPLVVGGQLVENKPKGKALRKALAEFDGSISIIISLDRLSFHDFSQALVDLGVKNAIYIVGGDSPVYYLNDDGERKLTGTPVPSKYENINYIVWR